MTFKEFKKLQEKKYLNMLLWDFWHTEWRWLCKHGYHNWQLQHKAEIVETVEETEYMRVKKVDKVDKEYAVCHCCGIQVEITHDDE